MIDFLIQRRRVVVFQLLFLVGTVIFWSCGNRDEHQKLFKLLDPQKTGITFNNALEETHEMNVIAYQDFYSGGGVSIGDIDNDGLSDVFLTGNQVPAKLYKNMGAMVFDDITTKAGLDHMGKGWFTGTSMVDINNDGYLDIYISKSGMEAPDDRANLLYINQGDGTFIESAEKYGIAHKGFAVNATFFDYDRDGDLDIYLVNQGPIKLKSGDAEKLRAERHDEAGDVLYENRDGRFVDVTEESGIYSSVIGFAHGVSVGDINNDGWEDIFVSNDFFEHDYLYINNGDKTFIETIKQATNHISYYSMGNDLADFNNDGLLDIVVLDMVAEGNRRLYSNLGGMRARKFNGSVKMGLHYQYMHNVLHLNNGNNTFSDIGILSGISKTDWSWAPVFADFDNDGLKDLYITNGIRKDIRNIDWGYLYHDMLGLTGGKNSFKAREWDMVLNAMPYEQVTNYMFKNNGDLTFEKVMNDWGMDQKSWSNGVAYGDLDNDGDLDLVVNNIDQEAFVYQNQQKQAKFIRFNFSGSTLNPMALGAKVTIQHGGKSQYQQHYLVRGYRSSMEPVMHFGLGRDTIINKIEVVWPDGKASLFHDIASNQVMLLNYADAGVALPVVEGKGKFYFEDVTKEMKIEIRHSENEMDDFSREPLLHYKLSTMGPAFAVADVNGDGLDDMFLGGAFRRPAQLLIQNENSAFIHSQEELWEGERMYEDVGAAFFDADMDGDWDLYVVSGGNENTIENGGLQDRLYLNDGKGNFTKSQEALPNGSGSVVVPADFDVDGDLDLFVGGRMIPGEYPLPADSYLLINQDGKFKDITDEKAPGLRELGMVTDALWSDYDVDGDLDLIVVGAWMPVTIFSNNSGKFEKIENKNNGLGNSSGWWWSIAADDFDHDGDPDFVVGNMGYNYKFSASENGPLEIFVYDFDSNNSLDIAMGYHQEGKLYPVNNFRKTLRQNSEVKDKIKTNNDFSVATLNDIYGEENLNNALHYKIQTLATSYIENIGAGKFEITPLDNRTQISNINSILIRDIDRDGYKDLVLAGNLYASEPEITRNDAGIGLWLRGDGNGHFNSIPFIESGLYIPGDLRHLELVKTQEGLLLMCAKNNDYLQIIKPVLPSN